MNKRNNARELSVYEKIKKIKEKKEISKEEIIDILQKKYDLKDFIEKSNNNCQDFFNGNTKKSINQCKTQNEKITAFINYVVNKKFNEKDFNNKLKLLNLARVSPVVALPVVALQSPDDASPDDASQVDASPVVTSHDDALQSQVVTSQSQVVASEEYPDDFEEIETPRDGGSRTKKRRGTRRKNNKKRSNKKRSNKKLR